MFNKVDRFIRVCDGIRCLVLFYNKKIVLLMIKLDISLVKKMALPILFNRFARIKIDSSDSLASEKNIDIVFLQILLYLPRQFLIKIKITISTIIFRKMFI